MKWVKYRTMIRFLSQDSDTTTGFQKHESNVYGKPVPCYATVTSRLREVRRGRENVKYEHHSGRWISPQSPQGGAWKSNNRHWQYHTEKGMSTDTVHIVARGHLSISRVSDGYWECSLGLNTLWCWPWRDRSIMIRNTKFVYTRLYIEISKETTLYL